MCKLRVFQKAKDKTRDVKTSTKGSVNYLNPRYGVAQIETERQRDRETERQRDRETEKQRNRETERQRDTP